MNEITIYTTHPEWVVNVTAGVLEEASIRIVDVIVLPFPDKYPIEEKSEESESPQ